MPPTSWNWRARTSAIYMAQQIPNNNKYEVLFCSSVLPLADLINLRPELASLYKVVYFHENHMVLSINDCKELKDHLNYNEAMSCLAADQVLFNSNYNRKSFLQKVNALPMSEGDMSFNDNALEIKKKSNVVYFPVNLNQIDYHLNSITEYPHRELYIVWPHRWEFDHPPEMFYRVIRRLERSGHQFHVVMFPQSFMEKPTDPEALIPQCHTSRLLHLENAENNLVSYYTIIRRADVILSTAKYEFFGSQILEAIYCNLVPVLPRLPIYEEMFKNKIKEIYDTEEELYQILARLCRKKLMGTGENLTGGYRDLVKQFDSGLWFREMSRILGGRLCVS